MTPVHINLQEWQSVDTAADPSLATLRLGDDASTKSAVDRLSRSGSLEILELRHGLKISANSFVGSVRLGDVIITVRPKIESKRLMNLVRYAYGLRALHILPTSHIATESSLFQDLLVWQLFEEVQELVSRGLRREYVTEDRQLRSPRGRIDLQRIAQNGPLTSTTLPCRHTPRILDNLANQVIVSGLRLGASLTENVHLRTRIRRLIRTLEDEVSQIELSRHALREVYRNMNRLLNAYLPAIRLIDLLLHGKGITLDDGRQEALPGFLFDMNVFFQELLQRFLEENLPSYRVQSEHRLRGMMAYVPGFNPWNRQNPTPRPDFLITHESTPVAMLDAKYRDLSKRSLPREMLYQLAIYALSDLSQSEAVILYPSSIAYAPEARIEIRHPGNGQRRGEVILRAVDMGYLESLVTSSSGSRSKRRSTEYAEHLAFGKAL